MNNLLLNYQTHLTTYISVWDAQKYTHYKLKIKLDTQYSETVQIYHVSLNAPDVVISKQINLQDMIHCPASRKHILHNIRIEQDVSMKLEGTDPFFLFSMFIRQFRLLIQVKELAEAGYRPQGISRELKQHSYVVGKLYQQARGFSLQELEQIYRHLLEIDIDVKTGQADMLTSLDLLVANLTITA